MFLHIIYLIHICTSSFVIENFKYKCYEHRASYFVHALSVPDKILNKRLELETTVHNLQSNM